MAIDIWEGGEERASNCGIYTNTDEDYIYLVKQTEDKRISDGVFCDSEETMYIGRKENGRKNGLGILRFEEIGVYWRMD